MGIKRRKRPEGWPAWFFAGTINEAIFCQEFLADHKLVYTENAFFTPQGKMEDEISLLERIYLEGEVSLRGFTNPIILFLNKNYKTLLTAIKKRSGSP